MVGSGEPAVFDAAFQAQLHERSVRRRDVRAFQTEALPPGTLDGLIGEACLAPSVGLSQPWRFVIVDDLRRRAAIAANFRAANRDALESYSGDQRAPYARLKLAGLEDAPCHLAVFVDEATGIGHGLGRRTMPQMLRYSAVAAICQLWLAARAQGVGMGSTLPPSPTSWACRRTGRRSAAFVSAIPAPPQAGDAPCRPAASCRTRSAISPKRTPSPPQRTA
jgi:5,6-dimethylbenzimidazole synthase